MDAGGLAQMHSNFTSPNELGQMPSSGLASRRGGQSLKPLSLATPSGGQDNGAPTPRTSRSHLLAGLRTAPKSATTSSFPNSSQALPSPTAQGFASSRNTSYGSNQSAYNSAPKTAMPQFVQQQVSQAQQQQQQQQALQQQQQQQLQQQQQQQLQQQQALQQQQQQQQQQYNSMNNQHFTMEQVLAPPEIRVEDQDQMDPQMYAQLVATNLYLAQQQRALQQELYNLQAAAQQFQGLNLGATQQQIQQQQIAMYQQQQRVQTMQQSMLGMMGQQQHQQQQQQQQVYAYVDPMTGQTKYYVDPNAAQQSYVEQQIAQMYGLQQQPQHTPRVQVSPPAEGHLSMPFRTNSPPKRNESPIDVAPLPPPSANAFRRGHKKIASLAMPKLKESLALSNDAPKSAGPRTSSFPMTPLTGYMPGGGRAGEHPVRQPKGPPSIDELKAKPTTKHEGSKNFSFRARRSAVHNLVRAGRERRKGTGSSSGSMSPVSESAEESSTPITDNESDSGRSGSGSLSGEVDCPIAVPRAPTSGTWGAIGSDRPSSRQKTRKSLDSISSATSGCESDKDSSFAGVFKSTAQKAGVEIADGQRKAPMMVLTSAEKRRASPVSMA